MKLPDHNLRQIDKPYIKSLKLEKLQSLCERLADDLREARERLNQNSKNSSIPPGAEPPWKNGGDTSEAEQDLEQDPLELDATDLDPDVPIAPDGLDGETAVPETQASEDAAPAEKRKEAKSKRKAGKQVGQPGFGRTQMLAVQEVITHCPERCATCADPFATDHPGAVFTAFQTVDVRWGDPSSPGIRMHVTEHRLIARACSCGHETRAEVRSGEVADPLFVRVKLSEWRLVGPGLATLIVCLALRFRLSRAKIREFLWEWMGLSLSVGTIAQTIHEAGAVVAPAEEELIQAVRNSGLVHADETPWKQGKELLWLWVFSAATVTLYMVGGRGNRVLEIVLGVFGGWLMTDGWKPYRRFLKRLRCWAHLIRKAKGLAESYEAEVMFFGELLLTTLQLLMDAVYTAREGPPGTVDLVAVHADSLVVLRGACQRMSNSQHKKARELAGEFLNDWDAIFMVLIHPFLPLTNNEAERCLRHWVIYRRICYGTRTPCGTRVFALLASVTDTCRKRGHSPWRYLEKAIADRRIGLPLSPLPAMQGE
jgi:transposase